MKVGRYQIAQRLFFAGMIFLAALAGTEEPWPYVAAVAVAVFVLTFAVYPPHGPQA